MQFHTSEYSSGQDKLAMKRKEPASAQNTGRGRTLISSRTSQQQQRKIQNVSARSLLPRSYSSPASQCETAYYSPQPARKDVMRCFSYPETKHQDYRRSSQSFSRPKSHGSRSELDSDLENFEQFEESLIDIDADEDERSTSGHYKSSPERDEPKKVVAAMLPGSGLQKVYIRPIGANTQSLYNARKAMKKIQQVDNKVATSPNLLNFRPLVVNMPARHMLRAEDPLSPGEEELQASPQLEMEANELERQLDIGEQHLEREVAIAMEESDADTSCRNQKQKQF